jgi:hypothetical protein
MVDKDTLAAPTYVSANGTYLSWALLHTYTVHVLVNEGLKLLLYTIAKRQHVENASMGLSHIACSDEQFMRLIFGIPRSLSADGRDPETRKTLDAAARCY